MELAYCGLKCDECPVYTASVSKIQQNKSDWQKSIRRTTINSQKRIWFVSAVILNLHQRRCAGIVK